MPEVADSSLTKARVAIIAPCRHVAFRCVKALLELHGEKTAQMKPFLGRCSEEFGPDEENEGRPVRATGQPYPDDFTFTFTGNTDDNFSLGLKMTRKSAKLFSKLQFSDIIMVLDNDGGVLPLAITCGSLALAHAGIEMFDLVAACSATSIAQSVYLDPTAAEETCAAVQAVRRAEGGDTGSVGGSATLATMPSLGRVTLLAQAGEMPLPALTATIAQLEEGCRQLLRKQRAVLCATA